MKIDLREVGGQTLRVGIRPGDKSRSPLLLFNGIGANIELVEPFLEVLDGPEAIIFDVPGVGGSPAPRRALSSLALGPIERSIARSARLRSRRRFGCVVGRRDCAAICFPAGEALPTPGPRGNLAGPPHGAGKAWLCTSRWRAHGVTGTLHTWGRIAGDIYGGRMRNSPELVQKHMRHVRWSSDYGYYLQLMAGIGWTSLPWLGFLRQPTLVMAGEDDPIVPLANGRIMAKLIPDARLVTLEDGHLFLLTSARESAQLITEFLNSS